MESTRPAPSTAGPPAYARLPLRWTNGNLRGIVLVTSGFATIWSVAVGANFLKARSDTTRAAILNQLFLIFGILYLCAGILSLYGVTATWTQRIRLVRAQMITAGVAAAVVSGVELARFIVHFVEKTVIISSCTTNQINENNGSSSDLTLSQAQSYCQAQWQNGIYYRLAYFFATTILSLLFASLVASYLHQLLNPGLLRTHVAQTAPSNAHNYPLAPYPTNPYPPAEHVAPAYDTAPPYMAPPGGFEGGYKGMSASEEKELEQHREQRREEEQRVRDDYGSTETVTLEPRMGNEGRV